MRVFTLAVAAFCITALPPSSAFAHCPAGGKAHFGRVTANTHPGSPTSGAHCLGSAPLPTSARGYSWRPRPEDYPSRAEYVAALKGFRAAAESERRAGRINDATYQQIMNNIAVSTKAGNAVSVHFGGK